MKERGRLLKPEQRIKSPPIIRIRFHWRRGVLGVVGDMGDMGDMGRAYGGLP